MVLNKIGYKTKIFLYLFLLVLSIVIIVGVLFDYSVVEMIETETKSTNHNVIIQLRNATDIMLTQIDTLLNQICLDYLVETYMDWNTDANYKEIMDFRDKLGNTVSAYSYFTSGYIYYYGYNEIIDIKNKTLVDISTVKDKDFIEEIARLSSKESFQKGFKIYNVRKNSNPEELTMVKPVGVESAKKRALLIININKRYFDDVMNSIKINKEASVFIEDETGAVISQRSEKYSNLLDKQRMGSFESNAGEKEGSFINESENGSYFISYVSSDSFGWKYFYIVPTKLIYDKAYMVRRYLFFLSLICLVLGTATSIMLANNLYNPINLMVRLLSKVDDSAEGGAKDDIGYINRNITKLVSENESLEVLLSDSMPVLKNSLLVRILKNDYISSEPLWEKIRFYKANILENSRYCVCIIGIDQYEAFVSQYTEKQIGMLEVFRKGIIQESFANEKGIAIEVFKQDANELIVLASLDMGSREISYSDFLGIVRKMHGKLCANMSYTITVGVGRFYEDIKKIYLSYNEARSVLGYKVIKGRNSVITADDVPQTQNLDYIYPFDNEKAILSCLKGGAINKVEEAVDSYFEYAKSMKVNHAGIRYVLTHLLNSSLRCVMEIGININDIFAEDVDLYNSLLSNETIDDAYQWFKKFFCQIIEYIGSKKDNKKEEIAASLINFIDKNYTSPELDLESISSSLHFSVSYLGKLFKDATGETIKDYLTRRRIEEAVRLLEASDLTVKEIGEKVGYPITGSFIKNFKKYNGETPGEYRDRYVKKVI